ncbi:MAG TPA: hydroxymyristoyl-ACP dehydratase [Rubrivivax sp.]|nr:hydroxymyristoyl-ACP dehydratase [Rubrivivax sp.]
MNAVAAPATLDHAGIAARIPHAGRMCLLDTLQSWSADAIRCTATSHGDAENPLRLDGALPTAGAIEYAAQAMALHGALCAAPGATPRAGFLASVRGVRLLAPRLDTVAGALVVTATRLAGDAVQALYGFTLHDERAALLAEGRATVILDAIP